MRRVWVVFLLLFTVASCLAKDLPLQTVNWPETGQPILQFTFSKFKVLTNGSGKEHTYITDATAQNLSGKRLDSVNLALYLFDKAHARIGDGHVDLTNVGAGEMVKFELTLPASGVPASISLAGTEPRTISITVNSVPQGALVKLDGREVGATPKLVDVAIGKHLLEFSKDGYNAGKFPLEIGLRDVSGGSVSYELGASARDTVELRDGTVLSGDLLSITGMQVQIRIGGEIKTYDRNQIKRVSLTERDPPNP